MSLYYSFYVGRAAVENLRVFLLNIGYNVWCLRKCLLTRSKYFFPNLRAILKGRFYQLSPRVF